MTGCSELPESERNRLLRRVDWRFLLADPLARVASCSASGALERAVSLVLDRSAASGSRSTLAVLQNPTPAALHDASTRLQPGDACYTEWRGLVRGSPARARRRLRQAGFQNVVCYWPWPGPDRCLAWLPLDAPGALGHYFDVPRLPARGLAFRLRRWWLQRLARAKLRLGLARSVCAVAIKGDAGASAPSWLDRLGRAAWDEPRLGSIPTRFSWLLLTGGPRSINKAVALGFADAEREPKMAVKIARVPESAAGLAREAETLRGLEVRHRQALTGVPRVLFHEEQNGLAAVGETALTGVPVFSRLTAATFPRFAAQATDWQLALAGLPAVAPPAAYHHRLVNQVLADFEANVGGVVDRGLLREAEAALGALPPLPVVCEQRDFSPWNVLLGLDGELVVLDWESSTLKGLPALDLLYFLAYAVFFLDHAMKPGAAYQDARRRSYRRAMNPTTRTGEVVAESIARYADGLGLSRAALRPLRVLLWMLHSRSEYLHFVADASGTPPPGTLRRSLFLVLWDEELRS